MEHLEYLFIHQKTGEETLNKKYEVVVNKNGYLNYTVTNIKLTPNEDVILDDYELIAGDVVKTGEIEIDDLVALNDHFGISISYEEGVNDLNAKYDLNEDGVIDVLDRNILKKNYSKKEEIVILEYPEETIEEEKEHSINMQAENSQEDEIQADTKENLLQSEIDNLLKMNMYFRRKEEGDETQELDEKIGD